MPNPGRQRRGGVHPKRNRVCVKSFSAGSLPEKDAPEEAAFIAGIVFPCMCAEMFCTQEGGD